MSGMMFLKFFVIDQPKFIDFDTSLKIIKKKNKKKNSFWWYFLQFSITSDLSSQAVLQSATKQKSTELSFAGILR